jgi:putative ABC transport system permease protein
MSAVSWATSWRAALRISRREVLRHRARNALIVAMLGLPVFGVTALETIINSSVDLTPQEHVTRIVGAADAYIYPTVGTAIYQSTGADPMSRQVDISQNPPVPTGAQLDSETAIRAALPQATLLAEDATFGVFAQGPGGYAIPAYYQLDLTNPALNGAFDLSAGRVPRSATEVDLSPAAARDLDVQIGGTVKVPGTSMHDGEAATFAVVGLMRQPTAMTEEAIYALPSAPAATGEAQQGWFVLNRGGVSWSQVERLNQGGYRVASRDVALNPPATSQVPYDRASGGVIYGFGLGLGFGYGYGLGMSGAEIAIVIIAVGIALLEVVLLAGPAFAVSARRREREHAMLRAVGADNAQMRRVVLADGLVLGAIAGVVGAVLGYGAGAAALVVIAQHTSQLPGAVHVDVARVAVVAGLSVVLGMCAALAPALSAAKRDVLGALNGRRVLVTRRVRVGRLVLGIALIGAGLVAEYYFVKSSSSTGAVEIVAGIALVEIGGILCTPAIIRLVARCGGILPLGPRLAVRDGARNSSRTTPAVAAMFAAVAGAVAAGAWFESGLAQVRAEYQPAMLQNQAAVVGVPNAKEAAAITAKLRLALPMTGSMLIPSVVGQPDANTTVTVSFTSPGAGNSCLSGIAQLPAGPTTIVCGAAYYGMATVQNLIGGPQVLHEVTGTEDAQADSVLEKGGVVAFTQDNSQVGQVGTVDAVAVFSDRHGAKSKHVTIPVAYLSQNGVPSPGFIIAPSAARALGVATGGTQILMVDLSGHPDATQRFSANQVLDGFGIGGGLIVDGGSHSELGLANSVMLLVAMLVAIGAAAIATGLALADGRADHETLVAVGGSPWTRRWLAGSTALVVTGLGVLIGVPIGFLIAAGLIRVSNMAQLSPIRALAAANGAPRGFVVPWLDLGCLAIAVPLLTALGAALLSRSRAHGSGRPVG